MSVLVSAPAGDSKAALDIFINVIKKIAYSSRMSLKDCI
jgi:hypothetical protein